MERWYRVCCSLEADGYFSWAAAGLQACLRGWPMGRGSCHKSIPGACRLDKPNILVPINNTTTLVPESLHFSNIQSLRVSRAMKKRHCSCQPSHIRLCGILCAAISAKYPVAPPPLRFASFFHGYIRYYKPQIP